MAPVAKNKADDADQELSNVETELYDRQIRLWGIESQEKLRAANVLLIGVSRLGSEIAKNILLAGVNSITFLDSKTVSQRDLASNFLLTSDSIGKKMADAVLPKAQTLNPLVKLVAQTDTVVLKNREYFKQFTIVVATGLNTKQQIFINSNCRKCKVQFICGDVFGMFGYVLSDLLDHTYYVDQVRFEQTKRPLADGTLLHHHEKTVIRLKITNKYPSFEEVLVNVQNQVLEKGGEVKKRNPLYYLLRVLFQFRDQYGRDPVLTVRAEDLERLKGCRKIVLDLYKIQEKILDEKDFSFVFGYNPCVCAILGGVIAQETIKAVSHHEAPIFNMFLLNPSTFSGKTEKVCLDD